MRAGGESSKHLYTDWPHDHVLVGNDNERIYYKDLSIEQWSYGYVSIIEKQANPTVQRNMLAHLKDTYMDSILYGFKRAKGVHSKVLTAIEDGKVTWHEPQAIAELRKNYAQRPLTLQELEEQRREEQKPCKNCDRGTTSYYDSGYKRDENNEYRRKSKYSPNKRHRKLNHKSCRFYNDNKCHHEEDHKQGSTLWRHVCLECKQRGHRVTECAGRNGNQGKN
jgi:hypothetical protein